MDALLEDHNTCSCLSPFYTLGGNTKTVMIANMSPTDFSYEDTHNTLKYANRAKNIRTKVQQNVHRVDYHISKYTDVRSLPVSLCCILRMYCFELFAFALASLPSFFATAAHVCKASEEHPSELP